MMLKRRYEPAETFSMEEDGFFGELYLPAHNAFPGKCLILFGGSAGKFLLTQLVAEQFVDAGMNVLALAYHGAPGLPKFLVEQPVDVIEQAAKHLKRIGYRKVGLWGISMGGCLALLAGSLLPELISCVCRWRPWSWCLKERCGKSRCQKARSPSTVSRCPMRPMCHRTATPGTKRTDRRPCSTRSHIAESCYWNATGRIPPQKRSSQSGTSTAPSCS